MTPLLVHIHIPKTAGSAFLKFLAANLGSRHTRPQLDTRLYWINSQKLSDAKKWLNALPSPGILEALAGHVPFGLVDEVQREKKISVILREPISRIVSLYHYIRNYPKHNAHAGTDISLLDWLDFVTEHGHTFRIDNAQVRYLCDKVENVPLLESDLELAIRRLETVDYLGDVLRFDEHVKTIAKDFGWSPHIAAVNVGKGQTQPASTRRPYQLTVDELGALEPFVAFDRELFHASIAGR